MSASSSCHRRRSELSGGVAERNFTIRFTFRISHTIHINLIHTRRKYFYFTLLFFIYLFKYYIYIILYLNIIYLNIILDLINGWINEKRYIKKIILLICYSYTYNYTFMYFLKILGIQG